MPRVASFNIPGLELWFWSNDHNPPHFHAKRSGEWELRVFFLENDEQMLELKSGKMPSRKTRSQIHKYAREHRAALLAEWEEKVNS